MDEHVQYLQCFQFQSFKAVNVYVAEIGVGDFSEERESMTKKNQSEMSFRLIKQKALLNTKCRCNGNACLTSLSILITGRKFERGFSDRVLPLRVIILYKKKTTVKLHQIIGRAILFHSNNYSSNKNKETWGIPSLFKRKFPTKFDFCHEIK